MDSNIKPIFLFADSQLLFYKSADGLPMDRIRECFQGKIAVNEIKAAYIGASNGDDPRFYEIFRIAMKQIEINHCHLVRSTPDDIDSAYLKNANIILLAGGDTTLGWSIIKRNGWNKILTQKYHDGAVIIGISAGAIHLGLDSVMRRSINSTSDERCYLGLLNYIVDVHSGDSWKGLQEDVISADRGTKGVGIPHGSGLIYHSDQSLEAIRSGCIEFINVNGCVKHTFINPPAI